METPASSRPRLSSWKEIATHLGVEVKSAQRYEKTRGLPVHRLPGKQRSGVFAFNDEIDDWLKAERSQPPDASEPISRSQRRRNLLWMSVLAAVTVCVLLLYALGYPRPLGRVEVRGPDIVGFDQGGREIWRHSLEEAPVRSEFAARHYRVIDWQGTGDPDAVAIAQYRSPAVERSELLCFSPTGKLLWKWRPTTKLLDFDGRPFEDVWRIQDLAITRQDGREVLWASIVNKLRWSSALYRIDADGTPHLHFANHGYVTSVAALNDERGPRLVVTGINNAVDRPFLALLGVADPPSVAPPLDPPRYRYANAPAGSPRRYLLLPNSELSLASGQPYPIPRELEIGPSLVKVETWDGSDSSPLYLYEFDKDLHPLKVRTMAGTVTLHRNRHRAGLLDHPPESCPELLRPHVLRVWEPSDGWSEIALPVASQGNLH